MDKWDPEDLAYAAGFLDGEGCFYADLEGRKISVSCSNTNLPVIKWFQEIFGGSVSTDSRRRKDTHRNVYSWKVVARDAWAVCCAVAPYLKEKAAQALLLIGIQQYVGKVGGRPSPFIMEERGRLALKVRELKYAR